jgi:hypothetical protein
MKSIVRTAGLCLVAMFTLSMTLAGSASAALLWLLCLPQTGGKFKDNQCQENGPPNEWESVAIGTKSDTVRLLAFSLLLIDNGLKTKVHCPDAGVSTGLIETNKLIVREAKIPNPSKECTQTGSFLTCNSTANLERIEAKNLPWTSEMFETEKGGVKKVLATIKGNEGKKPGWAVTCGGATDECLEETPEFAEVLNGTMASVLLVLARFENEGRAKCSLGGAKNGEVQGLVAILLWNGNGLSINT